MNSCSVVGLDATGKVVMRRRMCRETVFAFAAKLPACVVAIEARCGAHHMGRVLTGQGHEVRLMSPEYVRPYVKAQKNEDRNAEEIAEAATRPTMRFVALKSDNQLDHQTIHQVQDRLVAERTSLMSQVRSLLLERELDARIAVFDEEFAQHARTDDATRRLATIPGVGAINATALTAAVGDAATFARGRD
jgi:transposase